MRNLKRALSLALATVMTLGLMVVGSGASYKDVSSEQNEEAIEVLQAVGVMVGDDNGNFNPTATVTRNEMAVVMSNLMAYNVATYAGTSPFTDVPSWAEPYVAACWTNGITSGYSANYYGGSDTVTTSQAALMLMKALGYFQFSSDFADDWQLATVKQGNKIDLFEDVNSGVKEAMTRNDLAQLVLNTLESGMVEASDDTIKVTTNDATVEAGSVNYNYVASTKDYAYAIKNERPASSTNSTAGYIVELGEKLYNGNLKKDDTVNDEFGRPSTQWTYNSTEIGTYANDVTSTWTGKVTEKALYTAVGTAAYDNYVWTIYRNGDQVAQDSINAAGVNNHAARSAAIVNGKTSTERVCTSGNGVLTQVFVDTDDQTVTLTMIDAGLAEVTKVADNGDGTYEVTVALKTRVVDASGATFTPDTKYTSDESFTKGDIVVYTASSTSGEIESMALTSTVSGKVTAQKDADYTTLDGTVYNYNFAYTKALGNNGIGLGLYDLENSTPASDPAIDKDVTLYLDTYGYAVAFEGAAATAEDYLYITEISGAWNTTVTAKAVFYDGTKATIEVDKLDGTDATNGNGNGGTGTNDVTVGVYKYSKGTSTYDLTSVTPATESSATISNKSPLIGTSIKTDSNTVFVNVKDEKAYTGYSNMTNMSGATAIAVNNTKGVADIVFVTTYTSVDPDEDDYIILKGDGFEQVKIDGSTLWSAKDAYDINGEQITVYFTKAAKDQVSGKGLYQVKTRDGSDHVTAVSLLMYVSNAKGDVAGYAVYASTSDTKAGFYATTAKNGVLSLSKGISFGSSSAKQTFAYNSSTTFVVIEQKKGGDVDSIRVGDIGDIVTLADSNQDTTKTDGVNYDHLYENLTGVYVMTVENSNDSAPLAETVLVIVPKV